MFYKTWRPATDVFYSGNQWLVRMELAGVSPADMQIVAQRNVLSVRGRRRDLRVARDYTCHSLEINYTPFERSITLPAFIDGDSISCECQDGILLIYLSTR